MPAIAVHHTAVETGTFDKKAHAKRIKEPVAKSVAKGFYAFFGGGHSNDPDNDGDNDTAKPDGPGGSETNSAKAASDSTDYPSSKDSYQMPHHFVDAKGKPGAASIEGVRAAMSNLNDIPADHRSAVKDHLQAHIDDHDGGDDTPATKKNSAPRHRERALASSTGDWELRDAATDGTIGVLAGHFAVFNRWTEINSFWEGRFMEQIAPGAFSKTFAENRNGMRCLFQHGKDPQIGMKPLGPIRELDQDEKGASYEVDLMDTAYNRDLKPGLEGGLYGASFRFQVIREEVNEEPERSESNPECIPERTITEARVQEFGPVTFGAYSDATAGLRSIDDDVIHPERDDLMRSIGVDPARLKELADQLRTEDEPPARKAAPVVPQTDSDAPPSPAPVLQKSGTTRLRAPRTPLRTTKEMEAPKWKL